MMRPVWNLAADCVEYIGTLEQECNFYIFMKELLLKSILLLS